MNYEQVSLLSEDLLCSALFGLSVLIVVTFLNGAALIKIQENFSIFCRSKSHASSLYLRMHFVAAIFKLCLIQILAMFIWTAAVYLFGLVDTLRLAFMVVGSCFTTLGIISDIFPSSWQSVAFYIAFSGLFSFALATSVMISLVTEVITAVAKPKQDTAIAQ
jgi:hypothetical protein